MQRALRPCPLFLLLLLLCSALPSDGVGKYRKSMKSKSILYKSILKWQKTTTVMQNRFTKPLRLLETIFWLISSSGNREHLLMQEASYLSIVFCADILCCLSLLSPEKRTIDHLERHNRHDFTVKSAACCQSSNSKSLQHSRQWNMNYSSKNWKLFWTGGITISGSSSLL